MDRGNTPVPGLISSLEAMIEASVSSALDRRLGPARDPLTVQIEAAVGSALDRRLGPAGVDLDNRIEISVARAVTQRFGPVGSSISAQLTFGAPQSAVRQFAPTPIQFAQTIDTPLEHGLATLEERYMGAVSVDNVQKQEGSNICGALAAKEAEVDLQVKKESQLAEEQAMSDISFARRALPAESRTPPCEETPDPTAQNLEAASTERAKSAESVSTAARYRCDRILETDRTNYARSAHLQGKELEFVEPATGNLPGDSGEAEESLFVETEDFNATTSLSPRRRETGSIEKTSSLPSTDEHPESLSEKPYTAIENEIVLRQNTPSNQGPVRGAANRADGEFREVISFAERGMGVLGIGRPLLRNTASRAKYLPNLNFAVVVGRKNGDHDIPMQDQNKISSREIAEASGQRSPSLPGSSTTEALRKDSEPTDSGQVVSTGVEELLLLEQGGGITAPNTTTALAKRKSSTLENTAEALADSDKEVASPRKKRAKVDPPGYTEGPPIRFLKVGSQLGARAKGRRGYPRVVDLESFTKDSNKQNFTMADIVATILWNHKSESLNAFLDFETKPSFSFVRKEGDKKRRNFAIERKEEETGTKVIVGYHARSPGHLWYEYYEYSIETSGRWDPSRCQTGAISSIVSKKKIQEAAVALGSDALQRRVWLSGDGVEIVVS